jgi:hypothetical protein
MNISSEDVKFYLAYLGALAVLWRASAWVTRKQIIVENFLNDIRGFMQTASETLHRIETNHLDHIEKALTGRNGYVEIVGGIDPEEHSDVI